MSRVPYEVHRARKRAQGHSRVGSETPTETEFDFDGTSSLASYSTHVTSSSYRPSSSSSRAFIHEDSDQLRRRTLSPSLSQPSRSPSFGTPQSYQNSLVPPRQSFSQHETRQDYPRPGPSSWSLAPEATPAKKREKRPGETDEERRARREKRRLERNGVDYEAQRASAKSEKRLKARKEKEEEEERRYGSWARTYVKWSMRDGKEGSRWKGLGWTLGGVLGLRVLILVIIGIQGRASSEDPLSRIWSSMSVHHRIPLSNVLSHRIAIPLLRHSLLVGHTLALLLEVATLWTGVLAWTKLEGKRKGRSWRTQLIGLLTILLQPALISTAISDPAVPIRLGLLIWALVFFSRSQDVRACLTLGLLGGAAGLGAGAGWTLLPGFGYYILGKGIWLRGVEGLSRSFASLVTVAAIAGATHLSILLASGPIGASTPKLTSTTMRVMQDAFSANIAVAADLRIRWALTLGLCVSQIPAIFVLLYSARSTRISPSTGTPNGTSLQSAASVVPDGETAPIISLLPLTLAASAIPLHLLSSSSTSTAPGDLTATLLPLTLMMAIRGEDDTWDVGALTSNLMMFRLRGSSPFDPVTTVLAVLGSLCWSQFIGHSPRLMTEHIWLRRGTYMVYLTISTLVVLDLIGHTALPISARSPALPLYIRQHLPMVEYMFSSGALWLVWSWTLKKLVESAWAIGAFSEDPGSRRDTAKVVVQDVDAI